MKFKASFHLLAGVRKAPVLNGYRPTWKISEDSDMWSGAVAFEDKGIVLQPGEMAESIIIPLAPEYWSKIKVGDSISAFEGSRKVAEADITEIID